MTTPVAMQDAIPLLSTTPTVGRNNARDIRKILLQGLLLTPGSGGFTRRGVLHRGWLDPTTKEPLELKVLESGGGLNLTVNTGLFIVHRGAIGAAVDEGPYLGGSWGQSTIPITMPAASGANSRYDGVFARVIDVNIAADSGLGPLQGPYIHVISGALGALNINATPGTAGAPPATPDGYLPLAFVARATSDNAITQPEITDVRRGTGIPGTPRVLFPWDVSNIASDTGYMLGEERVRLPGGEYPILVDRWDGAAWRGTQNVTLSTVVGPAVAILGINLITTILTKTIADPGFPYKVRVGATVGCDSDAGATMEATLRMTNTAGALIGLRGLDPLWSVNGTGGGVNRERQISMEERPTATLTGAQTIVLCIRRLGGGTQLGALANISELYTEVVPAAV
jgi:hypothetical protein